MSTDYDVETPTAGKVVNMQRFRGGPALSPIRQAEAYWTALREGNGIPRRTQIDPRGLENILEYAFILERIAPGFARFRLAGQHLTRRAGMEVRGMPVSAFFTPGSRANISAAVEQMFRTPAIAELTLATEARFARPAAEAQMILLPLKSDLGDVSRCLGVLVCEGGSDRGPVRFDVTGTSFRPVSGLHYARPDEAAPRAPRPELAEAPVTPLRRKVPYLRLVVDEG